MLQGPYSSLDRDRPLIRVPFTSFAVATVLLPLTGLIACLFTSILYHYEDATYTHCKVSNYLPSISSAISRVPERYIWRSCIGLHSAPRFLVSAAYFSFYRGRFSSRPLEQLLSVLNLICSLTENTGLLLLTYVSSTETYNVHKYGFAVFMGSSLLHMLITCRLWMVIRRHYVHSEQRAWYGFHSHADDTQLSISAEPNDATAIKSVTNYLTAIKSVTNYLTAIKSVTNCLTAIKSVTNCLTAIKSVTNCLTAIKSVTNYLTAIKSITNCLTAIKSLTNCLTAIKSITNYLTAIKSVTNCLTAIKSVTNCLTAIKSVTNYLTAIKSVTNCLTAIKSVTNCPTAIKSVTNCLTAI
ncbi:post-GPI attachment to proteins factor 2-like, partial [Pseudochaenichthys georgianus]|uniref:post-GPI attachment to proteins factor 2-like n=1 Tax=Pseudochaenichthys georgianus TaxID=52239 RepID=UPI00146AB1F8